MSVVLDKSWLPCFPTWRWTYDLVDGKEQLAKEVINVKTEDIMGANCRPRYLRWRFIKILVLAAPTGLILTCCGVVSASVGCLLSVLSIFRIALRILAIIKGEEYAIANMKALDECRAKSINISPSELRSLTFKRYLREILNSIFKVVIVPFQMIALTFAALYGLLHPFARGPVDGAWMVSHIELSCGSDIPFYQHGLRNDFFTKLKVMLSDCIDPKMLPQHIYESHGFYLIFENRDTGTVPYELSGIERGLRLNPRTMTRIFGDKYQWILRLINGFRFQINGRPKQEKLIDDLVYYELRKAYTTIFQDEANVESHAPKFIEVINKIQKILVENGATT